MNPKYGVINPKYGVIDPKYSVIDPKSEALTTLVSYLRINQLTN